jgi:plasmid stability protein
MLSIMIAMEYSMGQILVRNLDDDIIETFKMRARLKGKSLEQEIRDLLTAHRRLTPEEKVAISREIRSRQSQDFEPLTREEMREGLE